MSNNLPIPRIIKRVGGGWIAVSPNDFPVKIGVTGQTEAEAVSTFNRSIAERIRILAGGDAGLSSACASIRTTGETSELSRPHQ
jgi:hypothetical protein